MNEDEQKAPERIFARQGSEYKFGARLFYSLLIEEARRRGLTVKKAVAHVIDADDLSREARLTRSERISAINTGYRRYHEWRSEIAAECDPRAIARNNFASMRGKVEIDFRGLERFEVDGGNALSSPPARRGRPKVSRKR